MILSPTGSPSVSNVYSCDRVSQSTGTTGGICTGASQRMLTTVGNHRQAADEPDSAFLNGLDKPSCASPACLRQASCDPGLNLMANPGFESGRLNPSWKRGAGSTVAVTTLTTYAGRLIGPLNRLNGMRDHGT
jgi:hypothetical protein